MVELVVRSGRFLGGAAGRFLRAHWKSCAAVALQLVLVALLASSANEPKVYLRNVLFSQFVAEGTAAGQMDVNLGLAEGFKRDADPGAYRRYLNPAFERELSALKAEGKLAGRDLAIAIASRLGDPRNSRICGVESLGKVVIDTDAGQGCCSDYSKAWLFYANYLGLQAREVNNLAHTTVEYWDGALRKWVWMDPFNKVEILDEAGKPLDQYEIRAMSLFESAQFRRLRGSHLDFAPAVYEGYQPAQFAAISWRRGVNFLEVEAWDARLRRLGLPKSLRQLFMLSTGIQPGWLVLTTNALAFYLQLLQAGIYAALAALLVFDAWVAARLAHWAHARGRQRWRFRRRRG